MRRVLTGLALAIIQLSNSSVRPCPPGYVLGSTTCVPLDLCPDGTPMLGGACKGASAPPQGSTLPSSKGSLKMCEKILNKNPTSGFRRVLLVNGDVQELFNTYVRDGEMLDVEIFLDKLEVIYFSGPHKRETLRWGREVRLSLGELVRGRLPEFAWQRALAGKKAVWIEGPKLLAAEYHSDLICGGVP
jgi:hypothetical protein